MLTRARIKDFKNENKAKANFDDIYSADDPREYFRVLYGLDYVIPDLAKGIFRNLANTIASMRGGKVSVLDVGCSYGLNGALLKHPLDIDRLAARYRELDLADLDSGELSQLDRNYYNGWPNSGIEVIGLDSSEPAVNYACRVGVIDAGIIANLESEELSEECSRRLQDVDLVISTGCVGYVGAKTFTRLLDAFGPRKPWIASFVLRMFDYTELEDLFRTHGLVTEKLKGVSFVQRRFHSEEEFGGVIDKLRQRNVDTSTKEDEGLLHAEFFLSRPTDESAVLPLDQLCSVTSGVNRNYGRRFQARADNTLRFGR
jgi:hypothetical protein